MIVLWCAVTNLEMLCRGIKILLVGFLLLREGVFCLRHSVSTRKDKSCKKFLERSNHIGMGLEFRGISMRVIFVHTHHHFDGDRFPVVGH